MGRSGRPSHDQQVHIAAAAEDSLPLSPLVLEAAAFVQPGRAGVVGHHFELDPYQPQVVVGQVEQCLKQLPSDTSALVLVMDHHPDLARVALLASLDVQTRHANQPTLAFSDEDVIIRSKALEEVTGSLNSVGWQAGRELDNRRLPPHLVHRRLVRTADRPNDDVSRDRILFAFCSHPHNNLPPDVTAQSTRERAAGPSAQGR
jgi:hypothetical protein